MEDTIKIHLNLIEYILRGNQSKLYAIVHCNSIFLYKIIIELSTYTTLRLSLKH